MTKYYSRRAELSAAEFATRAISLFTDFKEYFGLSDCLEEQCEFEDAMDALICKYKGHEIGPDNCGKPEHDYCYRCNTSAAVLGYERHLDGYKLIPDKIVSEITEGGE